MKQKIKDSSTRLLEAVKAHRREILREFLAERERLSQKLAALLETGVDYSEQICLRDFNGEDEGKDTSYFIEIDRNMIVDFKAELDTLNGEDGIEKLERTKVVKEKICSLTYTEANELFDLVYADYLAEQAQVCFEQNALN